MTQLLIKIVPCPNVERDERHSLGLELEEHYAPCCCDYALVDSVQTWNSLKCFHKIFMEVGTQVSQLQSMSFGLPLSKAPIIFEDYNISPEVTTEKTEVALEDLTPLKQVEHLGVPPDEKIARSFWEVCEDENLLEEHELVDELYVRLTYHRMAKTRIYSLPKRAIATPESVNILFSGQNEPTFSWVFRLPLWEGTAATVPMPWRTLYEICYG